MILAALSKSDEELRLKSERRLKKLIEISAPEVIIEYEIEHRLKLGKIGEA